ncbi:MAG: Peptidoglycan lytic exotransglycosylase [Thermodesulfobacteriota bacterium]|nr:Peptidoglycan lytic exotransglycosylase [Thermodesulfobacteriota bacterium]
MWINANLFMRPLLLILAVVLVACHPTLKREARHPEEALTPVRFSYPTFRDDMDRESLVSAIQKNIRYLDRLDPEETFYYGAQAVSCRHVKESQQTFLKLLAENLDPEQFDRAIRDNFVIFRATGRDGNPKVLFTGYFEPVYEARLSPDDTFKYPIYHRPEDLITADLSLFKPELKGERIVGRLKGERLLPYFSRYQIDEENALRGRNLEIAWLKDPVDVAFLQIQGSGRLRLPDGSAVHVGYSASNGLGYQSIGKYLVDKGLLSMEEVSMQAIRLYLKEHPETVKEVLYSNPSYVFFQRLPTGPLGNIRVPLTPGRSLALDAKLFPKGALAFISCKKPSIDSRSEITGWMDFSRFVLNQDTGGAIKGAGRADIFWGSGPYAEAAAGYLKHEGELYLLIKKPSEK